jgi:MYXO-CTERM domain-containing protein
MPHHGAAVAPEILILTFSFTIRAASFGVLGLLLGFGMGGAPAHAVSITLEPVRDNTLIESTDGSRSNGAYERFFSGRTNQAAGSIRRAVLAFDVAGAVPAGSTIQSVTLQLTHISSNGPQNVGLHLLQADWGEGSSSNSGGSGAPSATGDATWLHTFFSTSVWTNLGGDFDATASAVTGVNLSSTTLPTWSSAQMAVDVQGWLDDPGSQFGWVLIGNESTNQTSQSFGSREQLQSAARPQLLIQYTPEPAKALQLGIGLAALAALAAGRRRSR